MSTRWYTATLIIVCLYIYIVSDIANVSEISLKPAVALILARGGSKGIKLKNLAKINNKTLLQRGIQLIQQSKKFTSVWVSTDNRQIEREAQRWGAEVHRRQPYTATDSASSLLAVLEFLESHPGIGILGLVQVTSPFIKADYLRSGMEMMNTRKYNSVFTVTRQFKLRWNNYSGEFSAANFNPLDRPRRQDWNGEIFENGMFYLARPSKIVKYQSLQPPRVGLIEIPYEDSIEIDSPEDLEVARILAESNFAKGFKNPKL